MKRTKNEQELIKLREDTFKKMGVEIPSREVINGIITEQWKAVLRDQKKEALYYTIELFVAPTFTQRYFRTDPVQDKVFGRFVGQPNGDAVIIIYYQDILEVNLFNAELFTDHVYYILEHELKHYFGHTHDDMEKIDDFKYPQNTDKPTKKVKKTGK